jgi:hypothetical protein
MIIISRGKMYVYCIPKVLDELTRSGGGDLPATEEFPSMRAHLRSSRLEVASAANE